MRRFLQRLSRRAARTGTAGALALALIFIVSAVRAQTTNPYQLTASLSAGGGIVSGGSYQVGVALGQVGAGEASGGGYTLGGGIFGGGQVTPPQRSVYLPLVQQ